MHGGNVKNGAKMQRNSNPNGSLKMLKRSLKKQASPINPISLDSEDPHLVIANNNNVDPKEEIKEVVVVEEHESSVQKKPQTKKKKKKQGKIISKGRKTGDNPPVFKSKIPTVGESGVDKGENNPDLGPYLLKKAQTIISLGDNPKMAFDLVLRAKRSFESCTTKKPKLDYIMCLQLLGSMHCSVGQYKEAIPLLEHSIEINKMELGPNHALAKFFGCMRLGDIYAMMGQIEKAIELYKVGLEIQKNVVGDKDPRFGQTCRYVAEAYVEAFEFGEAEKLCKMAVDIRKVNGLSPSIEEAADRRLMGLICESNGNYEASLEQYVLARRGMHFNGHDDSEVANVDCNIGDACLALAQYDEAILSYKKALSTFTSSKGENHPTVALVFVRLGELYNKVGKFEESKSYCESALKIYSKPTDNVEDVANGLIDLAAIYESMNELDQALHLLHQALELHHGEVVVHKSKIAGIEAQIGVIYYMMGNYNDSYNMLKSCISKLESLGQKKSSLYGITLNQLGLVCVQLYAISEAAELFDEARDVLEKEYGFFHPDTLGVYSNLAGTYDALGRWDEAIELLEFVVLMREEKLGTADPVVDDEKRRLAELLSEAGKVRRKRSRSLETLLHNKL